MKKKQTLGLLLLLLAVAGTAKAQQWNAHPTGVTENLYDVCCIDTNTVFACGQNGVILKTSNGGTTWEEKFRYEGMNLYDLRFIDDNTGFAIGNYGESLAKTTNGGELWTWIDIQHPESGRTPNGKNPDDYDDYFNIIRICPVDEDTLYFINWCGWISKSVDGGNTASYVLQDCTIDLIDCDNSARIYVEDNVCYVSYFYLGYTAVYKSVDYGNNWEQVVSQYDMPSSFMHCIDKNRINVFFEPCYYPDYENVISTDNGFATTWTEYSFLNEGSLGDLIFRDFKFISPDKGRFIAKESSMSDERSSVAMTDDGGLHWEYINGGINANVDLNGIDGMDEVYYIASDGGTVYRSNLGTTSVQTLTVGSRNDLVFPNPAHDMIRISCDDMRSVAVYSEQGQCLIESDQPTVDVGELPPGIYLVNVTDSTGKSHVSKIVKQ